MDISSNKLTKFHTRIPEHDYESGNFKRETKSLPIAAENNAIRTNYVKKGKVETLQNTKCK